MNPYYVTTAWCALHKVSDHFFYIFHEKTSISRRDAPDEGLFPKWPVGQGQPCELHQGHQEEHKAQRRRCGHVGSFQVSLKTHCLSYDRKNVKKSRPPKSINYPSITDSNPFKLARICFRLEGALCMEQIPLVTFNY